MNKISKRAREAAAKTGELPHEFLLRIARGEKIGEHEPTFQERVDAAKAAAPYYAARLGAVDVNAKVRTAARSLRELSDEELIHLAAGGSLDEIGLGNGSMPIAALPPPAFQIHPIRSMRDDE
ncbi:hypothetical protein [Dokdonella immobilis]|uniref:hypothetical protein n=1 Tax=Dokdonella immobilis TaxID=578942 RepID=UPI0011141B05|nr:hypothetical protein [Dokdonella immobilis]